MPREVRFIDEVAVVDLGRELPLDQQVAIVDELAGPPAVRALLADWDAVLAAPDSAEALFLGHPHRRWSSFLVTSPARELLRTDARVMIVQGQEDDAVDPSSADVLFAELRAHGRRPVYRRLARADHSFAVHGEDGARDDRWDDVMVEAVSWLDADLP